MQAAAGVLCVCVRARARLCVLLIRDAARNEFTKFWNDVERYKKIVDL